MAGEKESEMKVTTVRLPVELHRALAHRAIDEDRNPSQVIEEALREYLARASKGKKPNR